MDPSALREALRPVQEALLSVQDSQRSMQEVLVARMALSSAGGPPPEQAPLATGRLLGMLPGIDAPFSTCHWYLMTRLGLISALASATATPVV